MKEPVDHILRPTLPWRSAPAITECGYDAAKVKTITRAEHDQRRKDLGQQRAAMITCMTCSQTAERWESWEEDPRKAIGREVEWEGNRWAPERGTQLRDELQAIATLISAHSDEFKQYVHDIQARREWLGKKPAVPKIGRPRPQKW